MTIELFKNHGIPYLRLIESRGVENRGGKAVQRRKCVLSIGPLSRHDDGKPDYLARLRQSFRDGRPLIKALEPYAGAAHGKSVTLTFAEGDAASLGEPKRMASVILDPVFKALGLDELFASVKFASNIRYDLQGVVRLLVYGRLLDPASKRATMGQNDLWHRPPADGAYDGCVYDALDVVDANAEKIIRRMNTCVTRGAGRKTGLVFYDVTNFFFETERPDGDAGDDGGNAVNGLRKMGVSKENRRQPIVQLGLFMDGEGIPLSVGVFPGNTLDHHTLRPAMEKTVGTLGLGRFILVADRGMYSGSNMWHVRDAGNGYIVSKSLRKSTADEVAWALSPGGYDSPGADFRCKSHVVARTATLVERGPDGKERKKKVEFKEKVVVYWSRAFYERERRENKSFLEFVGRLKANPGGFRVTAAQSHSLRRFLRDEVVDRETGDILDGRRLRAMIDDAKLEEFNRLMGYYQIATSELDMPDREVIAKYHGLTQIEDQFREMKGTLETRPVFVRTPGHIRAHLVICFIALTMMRLIQRKTRSVLGPDMGKDLDWTYGIPGERLVRALANWQVDEMPGGYLRMLNVRDGDIRMVLEAFGIEIGPRLYTKGDVRKLKSAVRAF